MSSNVNDEYEQHSGNMMVAGVVCLLAVTLFVLIIHMSATRCLFNLIPSPSNDPHRTTTAPDNNNCHQNRTSIGSRSTAISTMIPVFVYRGRHRCHLECTICLSGFTEGEKCRRLPRCGHVFHVECIDMWLYFKPQLRHFTCPICRLPVFLDPDQNQAINNSHCDNAKHHNHDISLAISDAAAAAAAAAVVVNGSGITKTRVTTT